MSAGQHSSFLSFTPVLFLALFCPPRKTFFFCTYCSPIFSLLVLFEIWIFKYRFLATVKNELKRYAAALILEKLARAQPQHLQPYIPRIFSCIFLVIHEQRQNIREAGALALRRCLQVLLLGSFYRSFVVYELPREGSLFHQLRVILKAYPNVIHIPTYLPAYLSIYPSIHPSIYLSIYLSMH